MGWLDDRDSYIIILCKTRSSVHRVDKRDYKLPGLPGHYVLGREGERENSRLKSKPPITPVSHFRAESDLLGQVRPDFFELDDQAR